MAWLGGGLVLAGATFGTFAIVEAGMASAAPSGACAAAEQRVAQARETLTFIEEFGAVLSFDGPSARAQVNYLIWEAQQQLNYAEAAAYSACTVITPTEVSTTTSTSTTKTVTVTSTTTAP
jgi:hypothetical protein